MRLALLNHVGPSLKVHALLGEPVSVFEEVLELVVLLVEVVEHEVPILDNLNEVIQPDALLVQFLDIVLYEVLNIIDSFDP